jgi:hypothetical protein
MYILLYNEHLCHASYRDCIQEMPLSPLHCLQQVDSFYSDCIQYLAMMEHSPSKFEIVNNLHK